MWVETNYEKKKNFKYLHYYYVFLGYIHLINIIHSSVIKISVEFSLEMILFLSLNEFVIMSFNL